MKKKSHRLSIAASGRNQWSVRQCVSGSVRQWVSASVRQWTDERKKGGS